MTISPKQLEALARGRATKAANKAARAAAGIPEPTKPKKEPIMSGKISDEEVWTLALCAAMRNLEIKSPVNVATCVPVADKALELFKAKFPQ